MPVVVPMNRMLAKAVDMTINSRLSESREASAKAGAKQEGKYLRRARVKLNARRNYHASHPRSTAGHEHKAPGSMKK